MLRNTCFASVVIAILTMFANTSEGEEPDSVLDYLAKRATRTAAQLPAVPETVEGWREYRVELAEKLTGQLGLPEREPMKAQITGRSERGGLVFEKVAYLWAEKTCVSATVIQKKEGQGKRPAIVIPSGWMGHHTFQPYRAFVEKMAREGVVVLFIDDPRTGLRHAPAAGLYAAASAAGTPVAGIQVFDAIRGLDYLKSRSDISTGQIGIAGLGEGAMQACLAAAIEPEFRFVAVFGLTTYEAWGRATAAGDGPEDPSAFVSGILGTTDMDRIAACIAPRKLIIAGTPSGSADLTEGQAKIVDTLQTVYQIHNAKNNLRQLRGDQTDDLSPYASAIADTLKFNVEPLKPVAITGKLEDPDFSMLRYLQRRLEDQAESSAKEATSRDKVLAWLRKTCSTEGMTPEADALLSPITLPDGKSADRLILGMDKGLSCPALLVRPTNTVEGKCPAVVLSHGAKDIAGIAGVVETASRLAEAGYWVIMPEHVTANPNGLQSINRGGQPSFYGDEAAAFYGLADLAALPPLALRVMQDLTAFRFLAGRQEVDSSKILLVGMDTGGIDACLAAVLEEQAAGVAAIDPTTVRDWITTDALDEYRCRNIMPFLPGMGTKADFDVLFGAMAPRPLVVIRQKNGASREGFAQLVAGASAIYKQQDAAESLLALGPRDVTEELENSMPEGPQRELVAAARSLLPPPPKPGIVGTTAGLKSRSNCDSAQGLIWIVAQMADYDQELAVDNYALQTWSFYNNNGAAQKGHSITPLLFKKMGNDYQLIGIGKTRSNDGSGLQTFPFEVVEGRGDVSEGCFFGWHTGDRDGNANAGVVEYENAPDGNMIILTANGQLDGQKIAVGESYRQQSAFPRQYSIMAVSEKK